MNSTNFSLIIFITILAVRQSCAQYGDLEEEIVAIKDFQKKLKEFVNKYTKDNDEFRKAQAEANKLAEFIQFEQDLVKLYKNTIKITTGIKKDLGNLKGVPKDIAGDIVRLHHQFVETRADWDAQFKKLWGDYSAFLNKGAEEELAKEQGSPFAEPNKSEPVEAKEEL